MENITWLCEYTKLLIECLIFFNTRREIFYFQVAILFSTYHINSNEILNLFTFLGKRAIYYVNIAVVKEQTTTMKLLLSAFSCLYRRVKIFFIYLEKFFYF